MGMRGLQRASGLKSKGAVRVCEVEPSMRSLLAALLRRRPSVAQQAVCRAGQSETPMSPVFSNMLFAHDMAETP